MENVYKESAKKEITESWLGSLNYRHQMFANKLFEACQRLDLITKELGGEYTEKEIETPINKPGANQLSYYESLLYNNEDILADIWLSIERLEELVSR